MKLVVCGKHRFFATHLATLLCFLAIAWSTTGCDDDPMRNGAEALYAGDLTRAEVEFQNALHKDKDNLEAKRRLADVELARKNFSDAEKILNEISATLPQQDRNTQLTINQKVTQNMLTRQYTRLYVSWIATVDRASEPDLFKHIFTEGIKYAPADATLNSAAVNYYVSAGDQFVNDGKELLAIENYRAANNFSMPSETKNAIEGKIAKSKRVNFDKTFARQLERSKETFEPPYSWNEEQNAIEITLDYPIDARKPKDFGPETVRIESTPMIEAAIRKLMGMISNLPAELNVSDLFVPKYRIGDIEMKRKRAIVHVFVTPAELSSSTFLSVAKFDQNEAQNNDEEENNDSNTEKAPPQE